MVYNNLYIFQLQNTFQYQNITLLSPCICGQVIQDQPRTDIGNHGMKTKLKVFIPVSNHEYMIALSDLERFYKYLQLYCFSKVHRNLLSQLKYH